MSRPSFFENGLRFECQGSGRCCTSHGRYGYVYLTENDIDRYASHFKVSKEKFLEGFCEPKDGYIILKNRGPDCIFLEGKRCGEYAARPEQCRTWPFWPETLNAKTWNTEVVTFCPGVGKGRLYTRDEIEKIRDSHSELARIE